MWQINSMQWSYSENLIQFFRKTMYQRKPAITPVVMARMMVAPRKSRVSLFRLEKSDCNISRTEKPKRKSESNENIVPMTAITGFLVCWELFTGLKVQKILRKVKFVKIQRWLSMICPLSEHWSWFSFDRTYEKNCH